MGGVLNSKCGFCPQVGAHGGSSPSTPSIAQQAPRGPGGVTESEYGGFGEEGQSCTVQYDGHQPHVATGLLNCGWPERRRAGGVKYTPDSEDIIRKKNVKYFVNNFYTDDVLK